MNDIIVKKLNEIHESLEKIAAAIQEMKTDNDGIVDLDEVEDMDVLPDYNDRNTRREEFILNTTEDILVTMKNKGVSKKDLAERLDLSDLPNNLGETFVHYQLTGNGGDNISLGTLFNIYYELGARNVYIDASFHDNDDDDNQV